MRDRIKLLVVTVALFAFQMALMPPVAKAQDNAELERKVERLEAQNRALEKETLAVENQLRLQNETINRLRQEVLTTAQPVAAMQKDVPAMQSQLADLQKSQMHTLQVGFLAGYGESPYDMPGGFFFGAYVPHTLLTIEDGVPYGSISGELMAGVVLGNHAETTGNLASIILGIAGKPLTPFKTWESTIEIQPTAHYNLDLASVGLRQFENIRPYVLAGPGIWISLLTTPVVAGHFPFKTVAPGDGYRHTDADLQAGGVYGAGVQLSLKGLNAPLIQGILDKTAVGAEWRFNELANGENFQQYMGSIALGF